MTTCHSYRQPDGGKKSHFNSPHRLQRWKGLCIISPNKIQGFLFMLDSPSNVVHRRLEVSSVICLVSVASAACSFDGALLRELKEAVRLRGGSHEKERRPRAAFEHVFPPTTLMLRAIITASGVAPHVSSHPCYVLFVWRFFFFFFFPPSSGTASSLIPH